MGSARWDAAFLIAPGLVLAALTTALPAASWALVLASFVVFYFIDSGHGVVTALRTYRPQALRDYPPRLKWLYLATPPAVLLGVFAWTYLAVPRFWTVLLYLTIFHHVRQFYGILRWYQKLNRRFDRWSHWFLYGLLVVPLVALHVRPDTPLGGHYTGSEALTYPSRELFLALVGFQVLLVTAWACYEVVQARHAGVEINRLLAIGAPAFLSTWCGVVADNLEEILLPLLCVHGVAYMALIGFSLEKTSKRFHFGWLVGTGIAAAVGMVFGVSEFAFEKLVLVVDYEGSGHSLATAVLIALYTVVPLTHYLLDAFIWRSDHPEASLIMGTTRHG